MTRSSATTCCLLATLLVGLATLSALFAAAPPTITVISSPEDLWKGFDPEALPLEIETIRTHEEKDFIVQTLRFTGEQVHDSKVRVFAIRGAPRSGKKLPGVLHLHGGGQTASLEWVRLWAKRGYVCVSFDFCGRPPGRTDFTDWGPIEHGNMAKAAGGFQLRPTPRESSWYHWALVSRRALTLLARHPQVNPEKLGVFGISVGGSLTWMVAGTDSRVKAAAPIYGCGYNYDRRNSRWGLLGPSDDYNLFQRVLSPEAHAPGVGCPLLFLSATNDGHGIMDWAYEALGAAAGPTYQAFSARTDHHVEPREGRNLPLWMDWHLKGGAAWPKTPILKVTLDEKGVPQGVVQPEDHADVREVDFFYALGDKRPQARFWRKVESQRLGKAFTASLPVMDTWDDLRIFASVTFKSGVCLSSKLCHVIPGQLGKARPTLTWQPVIEHGRDSVDHWKFLGAYTDPCVDWTHLTPCRDEKIGPYIGFDHDHLGDPQAVYLYTHILGDPQFQGRAGQELSFLVRGDFTEAGLTLTLIEEERSLRARSYSLTIPRKDLSPGWREVSLPLSRFRDGEGRAPREWRDVDRFEIRGLAARRSTPGFARLRWTNPAPK